MQGFGIGADDYVTKPFSPRELVARVQAVLRRTTSHPESHVIRVGDLALDVSRMTATRGGHVLDLTTTEFQLMATLARHPGRVFTRGQLLDAVRGEDGDAFDRAIDAHVKNIRRKIELDPHKPRYLLTVYGVGYKCSEL
jgi:DNA-binding response OmpR family regulator